MPRLVLVTVWYLSYLPESEQLAALVRDLLDAAEVTASVSAPTGVELVRRRRDERTWLFVISHTDQPQEVSVTGHDLVADAAGTGALVLAPARWRWFARAEPRRCAAARVRHTPPRA